MHHQKVVITTIIFGEGIIHTGEFTEHPFSNVTVKIRFFGLPLAKASRIDLPHLVNGQRKSEYRQNYAIYSPPKRNQAPTNAAPMRSIAFFVLSAFLSFAAISCIRENTISISS